MQSAELTGNLDDVGICRVLERSSKLDQVVQALSCRAS
jgi:hypothetical protein